jgi:hypothetical protein
VLKVPVKRIVIHYVDDFLFVVRLAPDAQLFLTAALALCEGLGIPMAAEKTEGPKTCLTFLGIELDTVAMEARLGERRQRELSDLISVWGKKERASVKELQSLTGLLNFACSVVRPGRHYLRRIINHTTRVSLLAQSTQVQFPLTKAVRADVAWWGAFLPQWDGVSLLYELDWLRAERIELFTDSCEFGYGCLYQDEWFGGVWSAAQLRAAWRKKRLSMPFLELLALVTAAATFGARWRGKKITFRCDAGSAVAAVTKCSSRAWQTMHLLRELSALACRHGFDYRCEHIPGVANIAADALSRRSQLPFSLTWVQVLRAQRHTASLHETPVLHVPLPLRAE